MVHPQVVQVGSGDSPPLLPPLFQEEWEGVRSKSSYWKSREQPLCHRDLTGSSRKGEGLAPHCPGNPLPLALPLQPPTPVSKG